MKREERKRGGQRRERKGEDGRCEEKGRGKRRRTGITGEEIVKKERREDRKEEKRKV